MKRSIPGAANAPFVLAVVLVSGQLATTIVPARVAWAQTPVPGRVHLPSPSTTPRYESVPPGAIFGTDGTTDLVPDIRGFVIGKASQGRAEMRNNAIQDDGGLDPEAGDLDDEEPSAEEPSRPRQRSNGGSRFDQTTVRQGQGFFETSCTQCHDAERATSKLKTYAEWLATVRRMAAKDDADIPAGQHVPIATYLASLNPAYQRDGTDAAAPDAAEGGAMESAAAADAEVAAAAGPPFTLNATISPVYRGTDTTVENKGFFPDTWLNFEWRPESNPLSAKVVACTSCHGTNNGLGVELVEAAFTLDLVELCNRVRGCPPETREHQKLQAEISAGRLLVPFGAFSSRVHPGALRTVSLPLMYNMGRRVGPISPGQPVINLPYSDEGVNLHVERDIWHDFSISLDSYAVNGLQQGGPGIFFFSRSYRDNNSNVAVGGRATIGTKRLRFGASISAGELQTESVFFVGPRQNYQLTGADVSYRYEDCFRAYYEYAIREDDSTPTSESHVYGNLAEVELLLIETSKWFGEAPVKKVSLMTRYDTLSHGGALGQMETERFTYGLNFLLYGGSLLILNHEHWIFEDGPTTNIFGARWTATF